ncbi:hypothetical protein LC55x_0355 [Lysobacter capsici]|nr:hypothetical protein LC55x_0355 [Lysobacter capsici]
MQGCGEAANGESGVGNRKIKSRHGWHCGQGCGEAGMGNRESGIGRSKAGAAGTAAKVDVLS